MSQPIAYWSEEPESLIRRLGGSNDGLTSEQALSIQSKAGLNQLKIQKKNNAPGLFLAQFKSPIILILLFATMASAVLRDWADSVIILAIVMGSAVLSFIQEYNAGNAAEKLREKITLKCSVLRDGELKLIPSELIVPGDIVFLSAGSLIPADGVVLEAKDFFVSQAVLTGETFPVEKKPGPVPASASLAERSNVVYMGANVRSGSAKALVVETGVMTNYGQIASRLSLRPAENEFQRGIRQLGFLLSEAMFLLVLIIFATNVYFRKPVLDSLLFSIALAVGLTPQLLPAIININLSRGSQEMAEKGVIVRRLEAIENFGSMDILCTDKTGTLTLGTVQLDGALDVNGKPSDAVFRWAFINAHFQTGLVNPLDEAIITKSQPDITGVDKLDEIPYDFERKRLSVVISQGTKHWIITKGAFERILDICTRFLNNELSSDLDSEQRKRFHQEYEAWSSQGYRVLGLAIKELKETGDHYEPQDENSMAFAGFLLFYDPPKQEVRETLQALTQIGVQIKIITGDNRLVAEHFAREVGLDHTKVLTGSQLDNLRDEALWHRAEKTVIFSEVDPNQKERIILALKKTRHVVGYMGDGINDAPSLHAADVGISIDNAVDVAKEAADFVLLKHDLNVLKQGILLGRKTFANTLKYVFMATSANFGNMFSVAGASLFLPFLPMLPKQILLINFLTDLPEMTIAGDNVDVDFLKKPQRWNVDFIRRFMLVFGPLSSLFDLLTFGVLLWLFGAKQKTFHTGWFIESVLSATLVVFVLRTRLPFTKSKPSKAMLFTTVLIIAVTLAIPYSPVAILLGFEALPLPFLAGIVGIIALYLITAELVKRWFFNQGT